MLDHLGNPDLDGEVDEVWANAFRGFAALPNTVAKLSGILGEPAPAAGRTRGRPDATPTAHLRPYYDLALAGFGPDRLMFGSDWPVCTLNAAMPTCTPRRGNADRATQPRRAGRHLQRDRPAHLPASRRTARRPGPSLSRIERGHQVTRRVQPPRLRQ